MINILKKMSSCYGDFRANEMKYVDISLPSSQRVDEVDDVKH